MANLVEVALALGVITLFIAFLLPAGFGAASSDFSQTVEVNNGSSTTVDSTVNVSVSSVGNNSANITVTDVESLQSDAGQLNVSETREFSVSGESVRATLESVSGDAVDLTVAWPTTYGWNPGAASFAQHLDLLLAILAFLSAGMLLMAVIR